MKAILPIALFVLGVMGIASGEWFGPALIAAAGMLALVLLARRGRPRRQ